MPKNTMHVPVLLFAAVFFAGWRYEYSSLQVKDLWFDD